MLCMTNSTYKIFTSFFVCLLFSDIILGLFLDDTDNHNCRKYLNLMDFFLNYEGIFSKYLIDTFKWMSANPKFHSFSSMLEFGTASSKIEQIGFLCPQVLIIWFDFLLM